MVWFLFEVGDYWPFVLQCPGSPLAFYGALPFGGRSHLMKSIFWTPRRANLFFIVLIPFGGRSHLMKSILWTPRRANLFFIVLIPSGCSHLGEVVVVDPEAVWLCFP